MTQAQTYTGRVLRCDVHDGDTLVNVRLDVGWGVVLDKALTAPISVRLTSSAGPINAPETYGPEAAAGKLVRRWFAAQLGIGRGPSMSVEWLDLLTVGVWVRSRLIDRDAYGRCIGEVWVGDADIGARMFAEGFAKKCGPGGVRVPFTRDELDAVIARLGA